MATTRKSTGTGKTRTKKSASAPPPEDGGGGKGPSKAAREHALVVAGAGLEKKAIDVEIIDVAGRVDYADFLVLMTGTSDRHVASLVQAIEEAMKKHKSRALSIEGLPTANWVLIDFADVVVHVFQTESRSLYDIDGLWMDARRVPIPERAKA